MGCSLGCRDPVQNWETRFDCSTCECTWKENIQEWPFERAGDPGGILLELTGAIKTLWGYIVNILRSPLKNMLMD